MGKKINSNDKDIKFMIGALDVRTHNNIFYAKNLKINELDRAVAELKKKFR